MEYGGERCRWIDVVKLQLSKLRRRQSAASRVMMASRGANLEGSIQHSTHSQIVQMGIEGIQ